MDKEWLYLSSTTDMLLSIAHILLLSIGWMLLGSQRDERRWVVRPGVHNNVWYLFVDWRVHGPILFLSLLLSLLFFLVFLRLLLFVAWVLLSLLHECYYHCLCYRCATITIVSIALGIVVNLVLLSITVSVDTVTANTIYATFISIALCFISIIVITICCCYLLFFVLLVLLLRWLRLWSVPLYHCYCYSYYYKRH